MKKFLLLSLCLCICGFSNTLSAQCDQFANDPFPLNIPGQCDFLVISEVPVIRAGAYFMPGLPAGATYQVSICNSGYPLPPNQMELVIFDLFNNIVIADTIECTIQFTVPGNGDYYFIFNEVGLCGVPGSAFGFDVEVVELCPTCFADRLQATELLLDPASGLEFHPAVSTMLMPFIDFGFGPGFEGLVPAGTVINPFMLGLPPFPGPGMVAPFDAYFVFIDDAPTARYQHPTRFVLLDPTACNPTVSGEDIIITNQGWWPVVIPPLQPPLPLFSDLTTDQPPSPFNPDGLLSGWWFPLDSIFLLPNPPANNSTSTAAGIVVAGDNRPDMRGDIPRWRKQLQDSYGVDSTRILSSANDSAVTKEEFCALLDSLCTIMPTPDTFYIRISTHGSVGSLCFANGILTANQLCEKFKKLAKKGKPIMLFIDACNSSSLYDANNWNFPAGSMIIVAAQSGSLALGAPNASQADNAGNPIAGTSFAGGMLSAAHMNCKNDTTDSNNDGKTNADTNKDGNVDDCEAFNWVQSQNPCFVNPWPGPMPPTIGTYTITQVRLYPAGPPPGFVPDTTVMFGGKTYAVKGNSIIMQNPMPSYRPVGNFSSSMNFNVQNNTGGSRNTFYMVFCGDVSGGFGAAWTSTANDSITGTWTPFTTSNYDNVKDETTVCWMTFGGDASNGSYIHFGYTAPGGKKLRPKRQNWTNSIPAENRLSPLSSFVPDTDKVPTTQSSIHLDASGSPLTVTTANLSTFAGGWGEPVNYTIGYRIADAEIPLPNLTLADPLVNTLPYILIGSGSIDTNDIFEFTLDVPNDIKVGDVLILQVALAWGLNANTTMQLLQWPVLNAAICEGDITFAAGDTVPTQVNSDGIITLDNAVFQADLTTLNALGGVVTTPGTMTELPTGAEVRIYSFGCEGGILVDLGNQGNTGEDALKNEVTQKKKANKASEER